MTPGFKNHQRYLDNFRQALENPKSWNLMGYFCPKINLPKKYIALAKALYTEYLTFNCLCGNSPRTLSLYYFLQHNSSVFFLTQITFSAETLYTIDKSSTWKCKFSDLLLLRLKFTKFLMSFLGLRVSFLFKLCTLFSVMRHNSSVLFHLYLYMLWTKEACQSANFQTFNCSHEN